MRLHQTLLGFDSLFFGRPEQESRDNGRIEQSNSASIISSLIQNDLIEPSGCRRWSRCVAIWCHASCVSGTSTTVSDVLTRLCCADGDNAYVCLSMMYGSTTGL